MKRILFLIPVILLTGCVSQRTIQAMIDTQLSEHHETVVAPALKDQAASIEEYNQLVSTLNDLVYKNKKQLTISNIRIDDNTLKFAEFDTRVALHEGLLLKTFKMRKELAEAAILLLEPAADPEEFMVPEPAIETEPVLTSTVSSVEQSK